MIIGAYFDAHWSINSSILPTATDRLSPRLEMLIESYRWMYDVFGKDVDIIVNGGDLTDTPNLLAPELTALTKALSYSKGIPEYHLLGNHERLTEDSAFSSLSLLNLGPNFHIIDKPQKLDINPEVAFYPYTHNPRPEVLKELSTKVLFSHLTILGSQLTKVFRAKNGIDPQYLDMYFDLVLNGHIHTSSWVTKKILNVGTFAGVSFSDGYDLHYPSIVILDTNTLDLKIIENPYAIRFVKIEADNLAELHKEVTSLKPGRYALHVKVPFELRDEARRIVDSSDKVVASRVTSKIDPNTKVRQVEVEKLTSFESGYQALESYIRSLENIPFKLDDVLKVIQDLATEPVAVNSKKKEVKAAFFNFKTLKVEGFMSIGEAYVSLAERGLTRVNGFNHHDPGQLSNGSGKSSLFEAIVWCLTGKTTRGTTDVINKNWKGWVLVELEFEVGSNHYLIRRTRNHPDHGNHLHIFKNGNSISGNTLRKSEEVLKTEFPMLDTDTINSIMILGQGMPGRFTALGPSDRKARLESISSSVNFVETLKEQISARKGIIDQEVSTKERELAAVESKLQVLRESLKSKEALLEQLKAESERGLSVEEYAEIENRIKELESEIEQHREKVNQLDQWLQQLNSSLVAIQKEISDLVVQENNHSMTKTQAQRQIEEAKQKITQLMGQLEKVKNAVCYACSQPLHDPTKIEEMQQKVNNEILQLKQSIADSMAVIKNAEEEIAKLQEQKATKSKNAETIKEKINAINTQKSEANGKILALNSEVTKLRDKLKEGLKRGAESFDLLKKEIEDLKKQILDSDTTQNELRLSLEKVKLVQDILNYLSKLVAKEFRGYLLQGVIDYLNHRLAVYSEILYGRRDPLKLVLDGNKLYLEFYGKPYENLSGGERRRVDLQMQFALRDLSMNEAGLGFSILVADEVFDNLDAEGISSVLDMIKFKASEIDTLFVVTHNPNLAVPFDSRIVIHKNPNGISYIAEDDKPVQEKSA